MKHCYWFGEDSSAARGKGSYKRSAQSSTSDGAVSTGQQPSEVTPQDGTRMLALCATPGQLDYFVLLTLQQHGQQSALGKGWECSCHNVVSCWFSDLCNSRASVKCG